MLVSRVWVKVSDHDFVVDDNDVNIQEGNGCEQVTAGELYAGVVAIEESSESVKIR